MSSGLSFQTNFKNEKDVHHEKWGHYGKISDIQAGESTKLDGPGWSYFSGVASFNEKSIEQQFGINIFEFLQRIRISSVLGVV